MNTCMPSYELPCGVYSKGHDKCENAPLHPSQRRQYIDTGLTSGWDRGVCRSFITSYYDPSTNDSTGLTWIRKAMCLNARGSYACTGEGIDVNRMIPKCPPRYPVIRPRNVRCAA